VENLLGIVTTIIELLLLVSIVAMLAQRIRMPYTVVLVLVGLALSFQSFLRLELTPELILLIFLPPLVFEAALHIEIGEFRRVLSAILLLAIPGVLIVTLIVAGILALSGMLDWKTAFLFGSLIAATDPVAVVSLFKALGAPKTLTTLVESESLLNDGTTIVLFHIILALLFTADAEALSGGLGTVIIDGIYEFVKVALGGVAIGFIFGLVADRFFAALDDHLIETTLTTIVAYGAYVVAERFHLSGVLAVVTAGILIGSYSSGSMSPSIRTNLHNFWEYIAFLANSLVFILIGMQVKFDGLLEAAVPIIVAVIAVLLARAVSVYGLALLHKLTGKQVQRSYVHVLFWGGLRGAVSLALVLSLDRALPQRELLINMTFGVALFTLLVQATTISTLLKRLGLVGRSKAELAYEEKQGRLLATRNAYRRLNDLYRAGVLDPNAWKIVGKELTEREQILSKELTELAAANPDIFAKIVLSTRREALRTQRAAVMDMAREGLLSETIAQKLYTEIDAEIEALPLHPLPTYEETPPPRTPLLEGGQEP